ncbi:MAG: hypothetical protein WAV11_01515 [Minisyncoccia bacterium]
MSKEKKCLGCGKTEDTCECEFFEADVDDEGDDELEGMSLKGPDGEDISKEEEIVDEPLEGDE